jgi:hypothetical protein
VNELSFHHVVLTLVGAAGLVWFGAVRHTQNPWPAARRIFVALTMAAVFFAQALEAFASLASASSLELFGFAGCMLGVIAAFSFAFSPAQRADPGSKLRDA